MNQYPSIEGRSRVMFSYLDAFDCRDSKHGPYLCSLVAPGYARPNFEIYTCKYVNDIVLCNETSKIIIMLHLFAKKKKKFVKNIYLEKKFIFVV